MLTRQTAVEARCTAGDELKSIMIFDLMSEFLARGEGKDLPSKVDAVFQFDIIVKKGTPVVGSWEIDLKNGEGSCSKGKSSAADAIFTMTDDDFYKVCMGTLNPQMAFLQGKMKIKGNLGKATKFTPELFPPPNEENIKKYSKGNL